MTAEAANDPRSVLITGTSTGIGEACALEFHRRGFRVFAGVRRESDGQRLLEQTSPRLVPVLLDVTDEESIAQAATTIHEMIGETGLAGLVNNAGITVAFPLELLPLDEFRRQFEVNLFGVLGVTQAMLPMLKKGPGRIVNMSSLSGRVASPYVGAYAASKHALEALSDSLRVELRHFGIKIAVVEPADVATPIWQKSREASDRLRDRLAEKATGPEIESARQAYTEDITAMRATTAKFADRAIPVNRVVRAVVHALCARRPKTRYPVGAKTWAVVLALRFFPDGLRDRVIRRSLGLK